MGRACSTYWVRRGAYWVLVGKPEGSNHLEDPEVDRKVILKWILEEWDRGILTGSIRLRIGIGGGLL
jgi:hypothetical protein